jgi:hypothetical protein
VALLFPLEGEGRLASVPFVNKKRLGFKNTAYGGWKANSLLCRDVK